MSQFRCQCEGIESIPAEGGSKLRANIVRNACEIKSTQIVVEQGIDLVGVAPFQYHRPRQRRSQKLQSLRLHLCREGMPRQKQTEPVFWRQSARQASMLVFRRQQGVDGNKQRLATSD